MTINYTYDGLSRLTAADYSSGDYYHYAYDAVGNRLTETTAKGETAYTYDTANRLTSVNGQAVQWDDNGNMLADGQAVYTYNTANKLVGVTKGTSSIVYAYSGLGDRLRQIADGVTTDYTLDINAGLTQVLQDGKQTYLYGNSRISQIAETQTGYFLPDALGSMRQMTDSSTDLTLARTYDPYGNVVSSSGAGETVYGYTSEMQSGGLVHLRARDYVSQLGRFTSRDTWEGIWNKPLVNNKWAYVSNNPINRTDPLGLWELAYGYNIYEGGIYGKGNFEDMCVNSCYGPSIRIPIFVPPVLDNNLYNDQRYLQYSYTDSNSIKHFIEYDILQKIKLAPCYLDEIIVPQNTDDWKVAYVKTGKSVIAFRKGFLNFLSVSGGLGMGYDSGYSPIDLTLNPASYFSYNSSIAYQMLVAQSKNNLENFDLVKNYEESGKADRYEAGLGFGIFLMQGATGYAAYSSRAFLITVQEHKRVPTFYRSIIETYAAFQEVSTGRKIMSSYYFSFENGTWQEQLFNFSITK